MKFKLRQKAALAIAGLADLVDLALVGSIPGLGEPLDVIVSMINSYLLKSPKPMIGLIEVASLAPPLAVLDFVPVHSIVAWMTIAEQNKGRR